MCDSGATHLRWWKSWASGEGISGKWYPQWATVVEMRATPNHIQEVAKWEPISTGPRVGGRMLLRMCSTGWA